jgi:hypothetical protein
MALDNLELEDIVLDLINKINEDRETAKQFLDSLSGEMESKEDHGIYSDAIHKYMKSMHKASDQMIKVVELALKYRDEEEEFSPEKMKEILKNTESKTYEEDEE